MGVTVYNTLASGETHSGAAKSSWSQSFSATNLNNWATSNIPEYAIINSATLSFSCKKSWSFQKGDVKVSIGGTTVKSQSGVVNSSDEYPVSVNIKDYISSGVANSGCISGDINITLSGSSSWWYLYDVTITYDYSPMLRTITVRNGDNESGEGYGSGTYEHGSKVTISATPNIGYKFKQWEDGNTDNPRTITVTATIGYKPIFEKLNYTITILGLDNGTVIGGGTYPYGTQVTIVAHPFVGYKFASWQVDNGNGYSTVILGNPATIEVNEDITYRATFEKVTYDIGYDNLFSFASWTNSKCSTVSAPSRGEATYDIDDGSITITTDSTGENYTLYESTSEYYSIAVNPNTEYIFQADMVVNAGRGQMFVFFFDETDTAVSGAIYGGVTQTNSHIGDYPNKNGVNSMVFTTPSTCTKIRIRVGATDGGCTTATYSNIGIYRKSDYDAYIKDYEKTRDVFDVNSEATLMTPTRKGYLFTNWNTKADGTGIAYTENDVLPFENLTLFAQWDKKTNNIYIGTSPSTGIYVGTTPTKAIYVGTTLIYEQ